MWRIPAPAVIHWVSPFVMSPPPPFESLVLERAVDHVGHGLESAVGMPRRALRLARRVLDLAHLVEMDERVEVGEVDAGERPPDREALALETVRGDRDAADRPLAGDVGIRLGDARKHGDVGDGEGGHVGRFLGVRCWLDNCASNYFCQGGARLPAVPLAAGRPSGFGRKTP